MLKLIICGAVLMAYVYLYLFPDWLTSLYDQAAQFWPPDFLQGTELQIVIVLGLLGLGVVLFALERISVDVITMLLLIGLVVSGVLTPEEAFAGFSNDIIIILASIFVISGALQQTGVMDVIGVYLLKIAGKSTSRLIVVIMTMVGGMSMFMNNTTATAVFIPPILGAARRVKVSPSKLLIPLAFASILGGTSTLIGTSTNVAVSGYMAQLGMEPVGLFELMPIGLIIAGVGILYMVAIGQHLLPDHGDESHNEESTLREYLSEVVILPDSHLIGQRIYESDLSKLDFRVLAVLRGQRKFRPNRRSRFEDGDMLLVSGKLDDLMRVKETAGVDIRPDLQGVDWAWQSDNEEESEEMRMAEVLIVPQSDLVGRTVKSANFFQQYGMTVLAIYRHGQSLSDKLARIRLRLGDLLLIQGPAERIESLRRNPDFWILEEMNAPLLRKQKGLYTVIFLGAAVIIGGLGWLPLSIAFLAAAVLIFLFQCLTVEEAYEFIDWRLIILIGGMTAFGLAMEKTGTAELLATWLVGRLEPFGIIAIMAGFFLLTILLTQPMSNAAAALVVLPVGLHAAQGLGVNERSFAIAIMLAASISFIAPFEPSCILVYGPGKYKFMDFVQTGWGLTLILMVITLLLVPMFWPL
jgi:di/tricarboxylate transporter